MYFLELNYITEVKVFYFTKFRLGLIFRVKTLIIMGRGVKIEQETNMFLMSGHQLDH